MNKNYCEKGESGNLRKIFSEAFSIPQDVIMSSLIITVVGRNKVLIENYSSILQFDDDWLRIQGKKSRFSIKGKGIYIVQMCNGFMEINGLIDEMYYE